MNLQLLHQQLLSQVSGNALLLSGPAYVGKFSLALAIAAAQNCDNALPKQPACGQCYSCKTLQYHADILTLHPRATTASGKVARRQTIPIAAIHAERDLQKDYQRHVFDFLQVRPSHRRRVVIVQEAESLGKEAANALLKLIEEPPHGALFVFLCHDIGAMLPTITSRSVRLTVKPLSDEKIAELAPQIAPDLQQFIAGRPTLLEHLPELELALTEAQQLQQAVSSSLFDTLQLSQQLEKSWSQWHSEALRFIWRHAHYQARAAVDQSLLKLEKNLAAYVNPSLSFQVFAFELRSSLVV